MREPSYYYANPEEAKKWAASHKCRKCKKGLPLSRYFECLKCKPELDSEDVIWDSFDDMDDLVGDEKSTNTYLAEFKDAKYSGIPIKCKKCKTEQPRENFYFDKCYRDGRAKTCKDCHTLRPR